MSRDAVGGIPTFVKYFMSVLLRTYLKKIMGTFFYVLACIILFMTGARAFTRQECRFKGLWSREKASQFSQPDAPQT
jgi:hypothetical protein